MCLCPGVVFVPVVCGSLVWRVWSCCLLVFLLLLYSFLFFLFSFGFFLRGSLPFVLSSGFCSPVGLVGFVVGLGGRSCCSCFVRLVLWVLEKKFARAFAWFFLCSGVVLFFGVWGFVVFFFWLIISCRLPFVLVSLFRCSFPCLLLLVLLLFFVWGYAFFWLLLE